MSISFWQSASSRPSARLLPVLGFDLGPQTSPVCGYSSLQYGHLGSVAFISQRMPNVTGFSVPSASNRRLA